MAKFPGSRHAPLAETMRRDLRGIMQTQNASSDLNTLLMLNRDYIECVRKSDVRRFRQILAEDFLCTLPDATLVDREQFLEHSAKPFTLGNLAVHDVSVRLMGDVAIVHAMTTFTRPDGTPGWGRYTDVWARRRGEWLAVAAHVTRVVSGEEPHRPARTRAIETPW